MFHLLSYSVVEKLQADGFISLRVFEWSFLYFSHTLDIKNVLDGARRSTIVINV